MGEYSVGILLLCCVVASGVLDAMRQFISLFKNEYQLLYRQRGDGFPLANMLALVSVDNKDLNLVLAAHIYTVCPIAVPTLPTPSENASEDELMESLGMLKKKDGSFETFERFLSRTEVGSESAYFTFTMFLIAFEFSLMNAMHLISHCAKRVLFRWSQI